MQAEEAGVILAGDGERGYFLGGGPGGQTETVYRRKGIPDRGKGEGKDRQVGPKDTGQGAGRLEGRSLGCRRPAGKGTRWWAAWSGLRLCP